MKIQHIVLTVILMGFLSACRVPFAPVPPTLIPTESLTPTKRPSETPTITLSPYPSRTRLPSETPTSSRTPKLPTLSPTTQPTATSPYPVSLGTPIPDPGFVEITSDNAANLTMVMKIVQQTLWQTATSRNEEQLFAATNNGMLVFDRQGQQLAYWPAVLTSSQPCETCLSINSDGSRFALMTHRAGKWWAQVYNVFDNTAALLLEKALDVPVKDIRNPVHVALSPDGLLLAYGSMDGETTLFDISNNQTLLTHKNGADSAMFSPDGSNFIVRQGRQMLFWKTSVWKNPIPLQLPAEDSPYIFSADGKQLVVAQTDKLVAYSLDILRPSREINIPASNDPKPRSWQIAFLEENIVVGYNTRWNSDHTKATVEIGKWDIASGKTLQMGESETDSPDALSALWGATISMAAPPAGPITLTDPYNTFRFVEGNSLLVNSLHSACWLKLPEGATSCFDDPKLKVLSSHTEAFREIPGKSTTVLENWKHEVIFKLVPPYPIDVVSSQGNYYLINVKNITTDVYYSAKADGFESLPGVLVTYAENAEDIVFNARQKSGAGMISMVNKGNVNVTYQKKIDFMLDPLVVTDDNKVYFLQQVVDQPQITLKQIDNSETHAISDVARLDLFIEPTMMSISANGIFAIGMKDGSVAIVSTDGQQLTTFQATYGPINGISLTADGRYLAVGSADGIRIFAVLP